MELTRARNGEMGCGGLFGQMASADGAEVRVGHARGLLFLVSVLGLFLELMLIRWIGTEIRIFAYLQNTVLVVCFMGLGLGCLTCRKPIVAPRLAPAACGRARAAHGDSRSAATCWRASPTCSACWATS